MHKIFDPQDIQTCVNVNRTMIKVWKILEGKESIYLKAEEKEVNIYFNNSNCLFNV